METRRKKSESTEFAELAERLRALGAVQVIGPGGYAVTFAGHAQAVPAQRQIPELRLSKEQREEVRKLAEARQRERELVSAGAGSIG